MPPNIPPFAIAPPFAIGCDGGGSGCRVIVADLQGRTLASAAGGPANVTSDFAGAIANLKLALTDAAGQLGLLPEGLYSGVAHFGLAGVQSPQDASRVAAEFSFAKINVSEDRQTALTGALGRDDGVLIALGTGTIIAAQRGGQVSRIGGWGLLLSDDASGAWLGRLLLQKVLLAHDRLEPFTALTQACFVGFGQDPRALVAFAASARPADYANFAPDIVAAAQQGDAVGVALMGQGAAYLTCALAVLGFAAPDVLCLSGGVGPLYVPYLPDHIQAAVIAPKGRAVDGAVLLAKELAQQNT